MSEFYGGTASGVATLANQTTMLSNDSDVEAKIDILDTNVDTLIQQAVATSDSTDVKVVSTQLTGYGDDHFNTGWMMYVIKNYDSAGDAPEGEWRNITNYISADGEFAVTAFSAAVGENDSILVAREEFINAGRAQLFQTTIDLHQAAASYDLATATREDVVIESLIFSPRLDVSDDANITGITVQTDHTTAQTFIAAGDGLIANLTAYNQIAWNGSIFLQESKKIQLTITGGTADVDPTTCDVIIKFRAVSPGGYLA